MQTSRHRLARDSKSLGLRAAALILIGATRVLAESSTWESEPISADWNTAGNWVPATVPDEVATFDQSRITNVLVSEDFTAIGEIVFASGASAYTITPTAGAALVISRRGVTNLSSVEQKFVIGPGDGEIIFTGNAQATGLTRFTTSAPGLRFQDDSSLETAAIEDLGGSDRAPGGSVVFSGQARCATKKKRPTITNYAAEGMSATAGATYFADQANAGEAAITCEGGTVSGAAGGLVQFAGNAGAGSATLTANSGSRGGEGGVIEFLDQSAGELCHVQLFTGCVLDFTRHATGDVQVGSLDGYGAVYLGDHRLLIGGNNLNASFRGEIQEGLSGAHASLKKIGTNALHLAGANTYTGGTTVEEGALLVYSNTGSSVGPGPVQVDGGALGGDGTIAGAVTIGGAKSDAAFLEPGYAHSHGGKSLTIDGSLTFSTNSIYHGPTSTNGQTVFMPTGLILKATRSSSSSV